MELSNLIDSEIIRQIQQEFCKGNGVYMQCLDRSGNSLTESYGSSQEKEYINSCIPGQAYENLRVKLQDMHIENMVEELLDRENARLFAVAIRFSGKPMIFWVVTAFLEDRENEIPDYMLTTTEKQLYRAMEFLVDISRHLFASRMGESIAQEAMQKSVSAEKEVRRQLTLSQSMTKIVRMLESEDAFEKIADQVIEEVCNCLSIQEGSLIPTQDKGGAKNLPFVTGKTYMISSDTEISGKFEQYFKKRGWTAAVFLPLFKEEKNVMYLCFATGEDKRNWSMDEIKFFNDVKSIIQGIYIKKETKNYLEDSYVALREILENAGCGIYVLDPKDDSVLYMNQRFKELFSHTIEVGKLKEMIEAHKGIGNQFCENYIALEDRWMDENRTAISWIDGRTVTLCTVYDVTDKKIYQQKIEAQANNDFLTGLYNRMRCEQDLVAKMEQCMMHGTEGALMYLDLDDFKHINDGLGHQYGDVLLKAISDSLRKVKGLENSCYRMGGDEFIIIVDDHFFPELQRICRDILDIFSNSWFLKGEDYYCTMSMGIVCFPTDAATSEEAIRKADLALYQAKRAGKNRIEMYNDTDSASPYRKLDLEKNIRKATLTAMSEFEVYYQPIIDIQKEGNPCCGAEALARWNSAEMGFISPADFIPLAEYLGLINPIGEHILLKAAKRCKYWNDMGHPEYKVNVNLSVVQLLQNDIVKRIDHVLKETRINPKNLCLEVTESLAIDDIKRMISVLNQIRQLGVDVALDDFGTGYSSLNHIRELPIDVIKIDRCFVDDIETDEYAAAFVTMVAQLADAIKVQVCVEGVETKEQYEKLKQMKVEMIQGFYFGKPMMLEDFERKYL